MFWMLTVSRLSKQEVDDDTYVLEEHTGVKSMTHLLQRRRERWSVAGLWCDGVVFAPLIHGLTPSTRSLPEQGRSCSTCALHAAPDTSRTASREGLTRSSAPLSMPQSPVEVRHASSRTCEAGDHISPEEMKTPSMTLTPEPRAAGRVGEACRTSGLHPRQARFFYACCCPCTSPHLAR